MFLYIPKTSGHWVTQVLYRERVPGSRFQSSRDKASHEEVLKLEYAALRRYDYLPTPCASCRF